jgi:hypothetical protein
VQPSRDSFASMEAANATLRSSSKGVMALWEQESSALGEIRRSGSDMYLSQVLLAGEESSPNMTPLRDAQPVTPSLMGSNANIHIENTPLMMRKPVPTKKNSMEMGSEKKIPTPLTPAVETTPGILVLLLFCVL